MLVLILLANTVNAMPQRVLSRTRTELAVFVRDRREALDPASAGLPALGRRRTPGLRREEVAALAGVGLTWYTWFEQGRDVKVSAAFLHNVARALRLNAAEHAHLFALAGHAPPAQDSGRREVPPVLAGLMADLRERPAFIKDLRWDILAWNAAFAHIFGDPARVAADRRNSLWLTFANPAFRDTMVEWERDARRMVGRFRADHARHADNPRLGALVAALQAESADFRRLWRDHEVLGRDSGIRTIRLPGIGPARFHTSVLAIEGTGGLKLVLYSPDRSDPNGARFADRMAGP